MRKKATIDPEVKKLWVEALRSGKYKKGINRLKYVAPNGNARFCCLGVLCELAVQAGVATIRVSDMEEVWFVHTETNTAHKSFLPRGIMLWAGMQDESGTYLDSSGAVQTLPRLNDAGGKSFKQIANLIEQNFTGA